MQLKTITTGTPEYEAMKALRIKVLLNPIGVPHSYVNPQKEATDSLLGAFDDDNLIGCCILTHIDDNTLQLRQMAVDTTLQHKGIGTAIVGFAEKLAIEKGYKTVMMHAREPVAGFYQKCGYAISGDLFFEVGIPHYKMEKRLA